MLGSKKHRTKIISKMLGVSQSSARYHLNKAQDEGVLDSEKKKGERYWWVK